MSNVRQHLRGEHVASAAHHDGLARAHKALAESFEKLAACNKAEMADSEMSPCFQELAKAHREIAAHHARRIEHHAAAVATLSETEKADSADDLNKVAPTAVSSVYPSNNLRAVPRPGSPEFTNSTRSVAAGLEKFVSIDD